LGRPGGCRLLPGRGAQASAENARAGREAETLGRSPLTSVSLQGGIALHAWYRVVMTVDPATPAVTGKVFKHIEPANAESALGAQVGSTLTDQPDALPDGVSSSGQSGIAAQAVGTFMELSITNFSNDPAVCVPEPGSSALAGPPASR